MSLVAERAGPRESSAIVLLHAGVADARMWDAVWGRLTAAHDVIRYDLRGFGVSDDAPAGPLDHVVDLVDVLDSCGVAAAHLVGASFGSGVAVETALGHPGRVRSLALCPVGGGLLVERTAAFAAFAEAENAALGSGDLDAATQANVDTWLVGAGRTRADVDPDAAALVAAMQRRAFEIETSWGEGVDEVELDPPAVDRLGEVAVPTLVLVGAHDLDTVRLATDAVVAGVAGAHLVEWGDAGHLPALEHPARFVAMVQEWLAETD
ncbi:MAG: alpha/beta fold hydrolase [Dermatophilaceae bacterium]